MEHKITIEIIIKTDFLKSKEEPNIHALKINPEMINSLMGNFVKNLAKEFPKEEKEEIKKSKPKEAKK